MGSLLFSMDAIVEYRPGQKTEIVVYVTTGVAIGHALVRNLSNAPKAGLTRSTRSCCVTM